MKILDCTLRDGGYYNNWDFKENLVEDYLQAMSKSHIDMVELGLRNYPASGFRGANYYTTESYLNRLDLPEGPEYGVMIDAKTILQSGKDVNESIAELFLPSSKSKISFIRLACHFKEISGAEAAAKSLKELGYNVFVNLMQISLRTSEEIISAARNIEEWKVVSGVYFADSLGNMNSQTVNEVIDNLRTGWSGLLGLHAHNNMGLALSNSLKAVEQNVEYIDVTVSGMGRGAGNTETEVLLAELSASGNHKYDLSPLSSLVVKDFYPMKSIHGWGSSVFYYIAARHNIHPSYVQQLLTDSHYTDSGRIAALAQLQLLAGRTSYDRKHLGAIFSDRESNEEIEYSTRSVDAINLNGSDSVLLLGSGDSNKIHLKQLKAFVDEMQIPVIAINQGNREIQSKINMYIFSHNAKSVDYVDFLENIKVDVVVPIKRFLINELKEIKTEDLVRYDVDVKEDSFEAGEVSAVIPYDLTVAYALAVLIRLGVKKIYFAGFDGYGYGDIRQKEMADLIHLVRKNYPELVLEAVTPSTYPLDQGSLYAPVL